MKQDEFKKLVSINVFMVLFITVENYGIEKVEHKRFSLLFVSAIRGSKNAKYYCTRKKRERNTTFVVRQQCFRVSDAKSPRNEKLYS